MVLHYRPNVFQITERIQIIHLHYFYNTVDDRTGFRAVDTINQLPCMFVQTKAAQRTFRCVIIKRTSLSSQHTFNAFSWLMQQLIPSKVLPLIRRPDPRIFFAHAKKASTRGSRLITAAFFAHPVSN